MTTPNKQKSTSFDALCVNTLRFLAVDMVQQAKSLNSQIIIPNVGSAATLAMLWQLGPDFIQGSYVNEPMSSMNYEFAAFG